MQENVFVGMHK